MASVKLSQKRACLPWLQNRDPNLLEIYFVRCPATHGFQLKPLKWKVSSLAIIPKEVAVRGDAPLGLEGKGPAPAQGRLG